MDDLQSQLQQQATFDSQGAFSVDWQAAADKLARFQLVEPRAYILKLIQWAVASGATSVQVDVAPGRVRVDHNGQGMEVGEFEEVVANPLARGGHLGVALLAVSVLKPSRLLFSSLDYQWRDGQKSAAVARAGCSISWLGLRRPGFFERSAMLSQQMVRTLNHVDIGGPLFYLIWDGIGQRIPEISLVRQRCFLAGIPVILNGRAVNRPVVGLRVSTKVTPAGVLLTCNPHSGRPAASQMLFVLADEWRPGLLATSPEPCSQSITGYFRENGDVCRPAEVGVVSPGMFINGKPLLACRAQVYVSTAAGHVGLVHWVQDGVLISIEPIEANRYTMVCCDCQGLQADLSQFGVLHNQAYHERLSWLRGLIP